MNTEKLDNFIGETSVREWAHYRDQAAYFSAETKKSFKKISERLRPQGIEIGKKYLCVEHPKELMAYSQFAPAFYSKLLKDNKLCLHFKNDAFKDKECVVTRIELYTINEFLKVFFWEIDVENAEGKFFTCRYATRYSNDKYPPITLDDLATQLLCSQAEPESVRNGFDLIVAMNHKGSVCTYHKEIPNDWVVAGTPVVPEGVTNWREFICHPESKMADETGALLSINMWLKACNSQKDSVV